MQNSTIHLSLNTTTVRDFGLSWLLCGALNAGITAFLKFRFLLITTDYPPSVGDFVGDF